MCDRLLIGHPDIPLNLLGCYVFIDIIPQQIDVRCCHRCPFYQAPELVSEFPHFVLCRSGMQGEGYFCEVAPEKPLEGFHAQ